VRYGQTRQTEVLHILVREPFDSDSSSSPITRRARVSSKCSR